MLSVISENHSSPAPLRRQGTNTEQRVIWQKTHRSASLSHAGSHRWSLDINLRK
jgi:hypothetical protein